MNKNLKLLYSKELAKNNLQILQTRLNQCISEGLIDVDAHFYNEILDLLADIDLVSTPEGLDEAVDIAKALENDISAWLARKGKTTVSLQWDS